MNFYELMTVDVPEGELDGMRVERFVIGEHSLENVKNSVHGRGTKSGTYTRLMENDQIWMSDTDAEKRDHMVPLAWIQQLRAKRILFNGLGLGMLLKVALTFDHVEHIDVVEHDERVIKLIGPHYQKDPRVHLHHQDAYKQAKEWPANTRWDVVWSDIWADISTDDLKTMAILNRSYGRRSDWNGCWGQEQLQDISRQAKKYTFR